MIKQMRTGQRVGNYTGTRIPLLDITRPLPDYLTRLLRMRAASADVRTLRAAASAATAPLESSKIPPRALLAVLLPASADPNQPPPHPLAAPPAVRLRYESLTC